MFRTKSFNLNNEERPKKSEELYKPKKYRWFNYFALLALVGFVLLLILVNVDFSGDDSVVNTTIATSIRPETSTAVMDTESTTMTTASVTSSEDLNKVQITIQQITDLEYNDCDVIAHTNCTISCTFFSYKKLKDYLAPLNLTCTNGLYIYLNMYVDTLASDFFEGDFKIKQLIFMESPLIEIKKGAFDHDSTQNLTSLVFAGSAFVNLDKNSFAGLDTIKYFEMNNHESHEGKLNGKNFLQPMSDTLIKVVIRQYTYLSKYDPTNWLAGSNFSALLYLNMTGNYFLDSLKKKTFERLIRIVELNLSYCSINTIAEDAFDVIVQTLKYIDLSNNDLIALDGDFLKSAIAHDIQIMLYENNWNCTCDNVELIRYVKSTQNNITIAPKCFTPTNLYHCDINWIDLDCESSKTTAITSLTTINVGNNTNTTIDMSDTSKSSEGEIDESEEFDDDFARTTTPLPFERNLIELSCIVLAPNAETFHIFVQNYDTLFGIRSLSSTSVLVLIGNHSQDFQIVYFLAKNYTINIDQKTFNLFSRQAVLKSGIHIEGLESGKSYVFCLVADNDNTISPFNCLSHYMTTGILDTEYGGWLNHDDIFWFVLVTVIILLICLFLGAFVMYLFLRYRPTWLKGSKRLVRLDNSKNNVILLPKDHDSDIYYKLSNLLDQGPSVSDAYATETRLTTNIYDYLEFYRNFENFRLKKIDELEENMPPSQFAPTAPSNESNSEGYGSTCTESTIKLEDFEQKFEEKPEYESLQHYEVLF